MAALGARGFAQSAHFAYAETDIGGTTIGGIWGVAVDNAGNVYTADSSGSRILKETWAGGSYSQSVIGSGWSWSSPHGVTVDSSGNVYVADTYHSKVMKVPWSAGSYGTPVEVTTSGLYLPNDVAVDSNGNIYIADTYNDRVVMETPSGNSWVQTELVSSSVLYHPFGIAVDSGGNNVYIADSWHSRVLKVTWNGTSWGTPVEIATGLNQNGVFGVEVDSSGVVYITDQDTSANSRVLKLTPSGGSYTQQVLIDIASNLLLQAHGIAVDRSGNVYVANTGRSAALPKFAFSAVNYGMVPIGANVGTTTLIEFVFDSTTTIAAPSVLTMGAPNQDFTDAATGASTCLTEAGYQMSAGSSCRVAVQFSPKVAGVRNGAVVLKTSTGTPIATAFIYGTGDGPQIGFGPTTRTTLVDSSYNFTAMFGVAVDGSDNVYISDMFHNTLLKKSLSGGSYTDSALLLVLSDPHAIAIDGAGSIYIAEGNAHRVRKFTWTGSGYSATAIGSGVEYAAGVAVDGSGNVYITDLNNPRVLKETLSGGTYTQSVIASGLTLPYGVAVDGSGNVFIADTGSGRVLKEAPSGDGSYTETVIADNTAFPSPMGIAAGGNGSIYVADYSGFAAKLSGWDYHKSIITTALGSPSAIAVDGQGNVYVVSSSDGFVYKQDVRTPPSFSFASTVAGDQSSDSPKSFTVSNNGTGMLIFPGPASGTNPSFSSNFPWDSSSPCDPARPDAGVSLSFGNSCTFGIDFIPTAEGTITGSVVLTDNDLNANYATHTIQLSGTATGGKRSQTITFNNPGSKNYGTIPVLIATASSGLDVTFRSLTASICEISSSGTLTTVRAGSCTIQADQPGDDTFNAATPVTQTFSILAVVPAAPTIGTATSSDGKVSVSFTPPTSDGGASIASFTATSSPEGKFATGGSSPIWVTGLTNGTVYTFTVTATNSAGTSPASGVSNSVVPQGPQPGVDFGSVQIGASPSAVPVTLKFLSGGTVNSSAVLTMGAPDLDFTNAGTGSCASQSYAAGATCTVDVSFSPKRAGVRYGAVVLKDSSGTPIATSYIYGTGVGPQLSFSAGPSASAMQAAYETTVASGLTGATDVAVDGIGNLYVADHDNDKVLKFSAITFTQSTIGSGLSGPSDVAVDGSGAVYIADRYNQRILKETPSGAGYIQSVVADQNAPFNLHWTTGVAVDGSGNVYTADPYTSDGGEVLKETLSGSGYTQSIVKSGISVSRVAVDGSGSVYFYGGQYKIAKETPTTGGYSESFISTALQDPMELEVDGAGNIYVPNSSMGGIWIEMPFKTASDTIEYNVAMFLNPSSVQPLAVAADNFSNLYVLDSANGRLLKEGMSTPSALHFAPADVGTPSPSNSLSVTAWNTGNATLTFPLPTTGENPDVPESFALNGTSSCTQTNPSSASPFTLAAGGKCTIDIDFIPASAGDINGNVVLRNNNLNASPSTTQSIAVSGTGTGSGKIAQTISFAFAGPVDYGATPNLASYASASSGLTVTFSSLTLSVCTITSGGTLNAVTTGSCTIQADQSGSAAYSAAPPVTQNFNIVAVAPAAPTIDSATAGDGQATISFTPPVFIGGAAIANFTATSSPEGKFATGGSSPITVTGLTNGKAYTFTVTATNSAGTSPASGVSNSVIPQGPKAAMDLGSVQVGASSSTIPVTLTFDSNGTVDSSAVLILGAPDLDFTNAGTGTCANQSYTVGDACTVNVLFSPKQAGTRQGAVVLKNSSGAPIATAYIFGKGIGPQIGFSPAKRSLITGTTLQGTQDVAVDGSGNVFIADASGNKIVKAPAGSNSFSTVASINYPGGIAVDGAGNLYVTQPMSGNVLKLTVSGDGSYAQSTIASGLTSPWGIAVDSSGNVYVAGTHINGEVLKETLSGGSYTQSEIATNLNMPRDVAVDGSGNVYITIGGSLLKETLAGGAYTQSSIGYAAGNNPFSVAVDANGNLYILDYNQIVVKKTVSGAESTIVDSSSTQFSNAANVAVDGSGNIYIAVGSAYIDGVLFNGVVKEDVITPPTLSFASTMAGQTSSDSPKTVVISNLGNASLMFPPLASSANPTVSTGFTWSASSNCGQVSAGSMMGIGMGAGSSCTIAIDFAPVASGSITGSVLLTNNNLNVTGATQSIPLLGNATAAKQSQNITFNNPGAQNFGTVPTLVATASSNLAVTFSSLSTSVCTITSGGTLTTVTVGSCTIQADQAGDSTYDSASPVSQSFSIAAVVPGAPTIGTATAGNGQATVSFAAPSTNGGATITGYTVTSNPGSMTGTGSVSPITVTGLTNGTAYTFTVTAANSVGTGGSSGVSNSVTPKGTHTITFDNPGSQNFGTSPTLSASATSGLAVTFSSTTTSVCTVTPEGVLTTVSVGSCTIHADQAGNSAYEPAARVTQSFDIVAVVPGAPTIGTATAGNAQATVSFTAPSSNGGATITGYTVTSNPGSFTGTGSASPIMVTGLTNGTAYTFTVTATNSVGTGGNSGVSNSITPKATQSITFTNPGAQSFGTSPTLSASATSGLAVTFSSTTASVCTVTQEGVLTTVSVGTCTIHADQAGSSAWEPAPQISQSFSINAVAPGAPTIGTATPGNAQATVSFTAPSSNGGASITLYTVTSNLGQAGTGTGSPVTVTGLTNGTSYTFTVTATNSAGTSLPSAASNSVTPNGLQNQTITFNNPGPQNYGSSPKLTATSSSGLVVSFSSLTPLVCAITPTGVLTTLAAGSCTINADQTGNTEYSAAPTQSQTFPINAVVPAAPTIGTASAADGQATVSFTAPKYTGGASITSYMVTSIPGGFTGTGTSSPLTVTGLTNGVTYRFIVTAINSAGAGPASGQSNPVTPKKSQTITFNNPGPITLGAPTVLTATASSGLTVTFSSATPSVCTIGPSGKLTTLSAGVCTISADQAGNSAFLSAPRVLQTINIVPVTILVSPSTLPNPVLNTSYTATISASGGTAPYRFVVVSGTLPPKLSLSKTGVLSGKAITKGSFTFTIQASDSSSKPGPFSVTRTYTVMIN